MVELREIQTSGIEHGCQEDNGEANNEGGNGAGMVQGRTVISGRRGLCR